MFRLEPYESCRVRNYNISKSSNQTRTIVQIKTQMNLNGLIAETGEIVSYYSEFGAYNGG
jgi:hypothetical protein